MASDFTRSTGIDSKALLGQWKRSILRPKGSKNERPNYFYRAPETLISSGQVGPFFTGSGDDIFARILPRLEEVVSELVIVTCFWAPSPSRDRLCEALRNISARALQGRKKIKVFIGLSSVSLFQKLFHTTALAGHTYKPSDWNRKLGLPQPRELRGLELTVKSVFIKPFSVMHPKFIMLDRQRVWLPSCNVSWETWFEGCIELTGPIVNSFIQFWESFWVTTPSRNISNQAGAVQEAKDTIFLPSPHHINPRFRLLPCQKVVEPPSTPLNTFILDLISSASTSVYLQTPNVTAMPVLNVVLDALQRGVDVHIVTSERLMILEQLVTAGTTTARSMNWLVRRYKRLQEAAGGVDVEARQDLGELMIEYYNPRSDSRLEEPVQSHLKLTIADGHVVVLGSGNMDRASWYTSQELGVAIIDSGFASTVQAHVDDALSGRKRCLYHA